MRLLLLALSTAVLMAAAGAGMVAPARAAGEQCTGANCPQPSGQGSGKGCEHRKENTVS